MSNKHTPGPWTVGLADWSPETGNVRYELEVVKTASATDARVIGASPELLNELQLAHQVIRNATSLMTAEQKAAWGNLNERDGCDGEGITRANERLTLIVKVTGVAP